MINKVKEANYFIYILSAFEVKIALHLVLVSFLSQCTSLPFYDFTPLTYSISGKGNSQCNRSSNLPGQTLRNCYILSDLLYFL